MKLIAKNITFSIGSKIIQPGESIEVDEINPGLQGYINSGRILVEDKVSEPIEAPETITPNPVNDTVVDRLIDNEDEALLYLNQNTYTIKKKLGSMNLKPSDIDLLISAESNGKNRKKILSFLESLR